MAVKAPKTFLAVATLAAFAGCGGNALKVGDGGGAGSGNAGQSGTGAQGSAGSGSEGQGGSAGQGGNAGGGAPCSGLDARTCAARPDCFTFKCPSCYGQ